MQCGKKRGVKQDREGEWFNNNTDGESRHQVLMASLLVLRGNRRGDQVITQLQWNVLVGVLDPRPLLIAQKCTQHFFVTSVNAFYNEQFQKPATEKDTLLLLGVSETPAVNLQWIFISSVSVTGVDRPLNATPSVAKRKIQTICSYIAQINKKMLPYQLHKTQWWPIRFWGVGPVSPLATSLAPPCMQTLDNVYPNILQAKRQN